MPHVSSIFPKLVSAVTIVMASSDATRNAMKCEFFRNKIVLPSILLFLDAYEFDDTWVGETGGHWDTGSIGTPPLIENP